MKDVLADAYAKKRGLHKIAAPSKIGAPRREFQQHYGDAICEMIADGIALEAICRAKGFPAKSTVRKWLSDNEVFANDFARAREEQGHYFAERAALIGEGLLDGSIKDSQAARVALEAFKWSAGVRNRNHYGEKRLLEQHVTASDNIAGLLQSIADTGRDDQPEVIELESQPVPKLDD